MRYSKYAVVVLNGILPSVTLVNKLCASAHLVVCADGAANCLVTKGIKPDVIIGDLDSLSDHTRSICASDTKIIKNPCQYSTDFEKTLDYLKGSGLTDVIIIGISGGRFDHAATNLGVVHKYAHIFSLWLAHDEGFGCFLCATNDVEVVCSLDEIPVGTTVSLLSFSSALNISTQGLKYPLFKESLVWGSRDGQSNFIITQPAFLTFNCGSMLVYVVGIEITTRFRAECN
jgi:thiamine pyrophosphokinase